MASLLQRFAHVFYGMYIYMGAEYIRRQTENLYYMKLLGASVIPVKSRSYTIKNALN